MPVIKKLRIIPPEGSTNQVCGGVYRVSSIFRVSPGRTTRQQPRKGKERAEGGWTPASGARHPRLNPLRQQLTIFWCHRSVRQRQRSKPDVFHQNGKNHSSVLFHYPDACHWNGREQESSLHPLEPSQPHVPLGQYRSRCGCQYWQSSLGIRPSQHHLPC